MNGWGNCISDGGVMTISCLPILFSNILYWLLVFSGAVALIFIILSGIKFITSGGDTKQVEGARKTLTWALIGLVLILISFGIVNTFSNLTGAKIQPNVSFPGSCLSNNSFCTTDAECCTGACRTTGQNKQCEP